VGKKYLLSLKQNIAKKNFGTKTVLTKGKEVRNNTAFINFKKNQNSQLNVLINTLQLKKKIYGLVKYADGSLSYITLTSGFFLGDYNYTTNLPPYLWYFHKPGVTVLLFFLKKFSIFNGLTVKTTSKYAKANGTFCQVLEIFEDLNLAKVMLPSGQSKVVTTLKFVTLGRCANLLSNREVYGKAGSLRNRGIKPKVRGVAMNPVDHPHGGRSNTSKPEVSPWGWVTKKTK